MDWEEEATKGSWHWKAATRTVRWSVKAIPLNQGGSNRLHESGPSPPHTQTYHNMTTICTVCMWNGGNMSAQSQSGGWRRKRLTLSDWHQAWRGWFTSAAREMATTQQKVSAKALHAAPRDLGEEGQRTVSAYAASLNKYFRNQAPLTQRKMFDQTRSGVSLTWNSKTFHLECI